MAYCTKCGSLLSESAKFCENCGEPVSFAGTSQQTTNFTEEPAGDVFETTQTQDTVVEESVQDKTVNKYGIASLVLGILAIALMFASWNPAVACLDLVFGILAIVFGTIGLKQAKLNGTPTGIATAGLVCGIVSVTIAALGMLLLGSCAIIACSTIDLSRLFSNIY